ncbi:MAG: PTS system nitrogen regulatory IIA component [Planctomycetota bacterium]|jgi:PTS system nitrogen regulatory IIA component
MNFDQAADYLQINRATLERWIRQGLLANAGLGPAGLESGALAGWARRRGISVREAPRTRATAPENLLAEAIGRGVLRPQVEAVDARAAIVATVGAVDLADAERGQLLEDVLERERMAATALGHGIAIPHPRRPAEELVQQPVVHVSFLAQPLDWAAPDRRPVHTVFLLLSPSMPVHLQLLSRIAFALRSPGIEAFLETQPSRAALVARLHSISKTD